MGELLLPSELNTPNLTNNPHHMCTHRHKSNTHKHTHTDTYTYTHTQTHTHKHLHSPPTSHNFKLRRTRLIKEGRLNGRIVIASP